MLCAGIAMTNILDRNYAYMIKHSLYTQFIPNDLPWNYHTYIGKANKYG